MEENNPTFLRLHSNLKLSFVSSVFTNRAFNLPPISNVLFYIRMIKILDDLHDAFIDRIYEASVVPSEWREVLKLFAELADSKQGIMIATNGQDYRWVGSSPEADKITQEHYAFDGALERTRRLVGLHKPGFVSDFDVFSDVEMRNLPLFADYLIPMGLGRGIATVVELPTGEMIIVHAEGDIGLGGFTPGVVKRLNGLRSHIARSAMISARLAFERVQTAVATLSSIGLAACAVRANGRVLLANESFELASAHWTTRMGGKIGLVDRRADIQLKVALETISSNYGVRSIPLVAREASAAAVLHVVPIRRSAHDLFGHASAILVLSTSSKNLKHPSALLQVLFDLSPAESEIANRLSNGEALSEIAYLSGRSIFTVRQQLKNILLKTNCHRQIELVILLNDLKI